MKEIIEKLKKKVLGRVKVDVGRTYIVLNKVASSWSFELKLTQYIIVYCFIMYYNNEMYV